MPSVVRQRYYTPGEVALHSSSKDIWVSFLGRVYDLTELVAKFEGNILLKPILEFGGRDISHWFKSSGGKELDAQLKTHIDPVTGCEVPYTPQGRFLHVPPPYPSISWANDFGTPWWKDEKYCIGNLSAKTRKIRVINTLTSQEHTIELCSEETLEEILNRFYKYNAHAGSYTWKYNGVNLSMNKTLEQNGVKDEDEEFYELNFNEEHWLPALHIYFNDDLTEA